MGAVRCTGAAQCTPSGLLKTPLFLSSCVKGKATQERQEQGRSDELKVGERKGKGREDGKAKREGKKGTWRNESGEELKGEREE